MGGVEFCTTGREADNVEPHMWPQLRGLSSLRCVTPEHVALKDLELLQYHRRMQCARAVSSHPKTPGLTTHSAVVNSTLCTLPKPNRSFTQCEHCPIPTPGTV